MKSASKRLTDDNGSHRAAATAPAFKMRRAGECAKRIFVRPIISAIFDELVTRHRNEKRIDLDDISEVIGTRAVSYEEVEYLVDRLEAEGFSVGEGIDTADVEIMQLVLGHARALREALGRKPTVNEVATASGKPVYVVRRALERASGKLAKPHE